MILRGFVLRFVVVALITWILGAIAESFWWGLYFALLPFIIYEMVRPRPSRGNRENNHPEEELTTMPRTLYSPRLSDNVVRLLYRESQRRRMPMTKLADELLWQSLTGSSRDPSPPIKVQEDRPESDKRGAS